MENQLEMYNYPERLLDQSAAASSLARRNWLI
jgi:hypothetical protein